MDTILPFLFIGLIIYFLPALIAQHRHKRNLGAIVVFNLFLGWTLVGWVVALVWATAKDQDKTTVIRASHSDADELAKLADLKSKGVISEAEFETKKKKLLS
jgi:hypothetical protein